MAQRRVLSLFVLLMAAVQIMAQPVRPRNTTLVPIQAEMLTDMKKSLKLLSNDVLTLIDLLNQKLGLPPDEHDRVSESTLKRRMREALEKEKLERGWVKGNKCRTIITKDIGSVIIDANTWVLLLHKIGPRWDVKLLGGVMNGGAEGTASNKEANYHENEIICEPLPEITGDLALQSREFDFEREYKRWGILIYFRTWFYAICFLIDVVIWTSLQLFLDSIDVKRRRRRILLDLERTALAKLSRLGKAGVGGASGISNERSTGVQLNWRQRLEFLLQEEILAKYVDEYLGKVCISFGVAVGIRMLSLFFDTDSVTFSLLNNLVITLRVLALVTFFIKDDLLLIQPTVGTEKNSSEKTGPATAAQSPAFGNYSPSVSSNVGTSYHHFRSGSPAASDYASPMGGPAVPPAFLRPPAAKPPQPSGSQPHLPAPPAVMPPSGGDAAAPYYEDKRE